MSYRRSEHSRDRLDDRKRATTRDGTINNLKKIINAGWPSSNPMCPKCSMNKKSCKNHVNVANLSKEHSRKNH